MEPLTPGDEQLAYWQDKQEQAKPRKKSQPKEFCLGEWFRGLLQHYGISPDVAGLMILAINGYGNEMLDAGYSEQEIVDVIYPIYEEIAETATRLAYFAAYFKHTLKEAEAYTAESRAEGIFHGKNSRGVLELKLKGFVQRMKRNIYRQRIDSLVPWELPIVEGGGKWQYRKVLG
jgi:hypothetical protein